MSQAAQAEDLRDWIRGRLDPLEADEPKDAVPVAAPNGGPAEFMGKPTPAAVLIGLIERPHGCTLLLTRRADTLRAHTGQIALPGGRRDPGEPAWRTALREAEEEVGLDRRFVTLAGLSTPTLTDTGYLIVPVVGFIREGFTLAPNPDEVADVFETPFEFLMDPANHQEHAHERDDGRIRNYYAMMHDDRFIWGVTAGILRQLYVRLYGADAA